MPDSNHIVRPFAYILIVEEDVVLHDFILHSFQKSNSAVDVARDVDEAVAKSLQHRPQLIIVKQHIPLNVDELHPPDVSLASRICRRARLSRAVRLVTHSDAAIALRWHNWPSVKTFSDRHLSIIARPVFDTQPWRKEWYSYSNSEVAVKFLSFHLKLWLGAAQPPPDLRVIRMPGSPLPWATPARLSLN